ncbi:hypothetical protein PsorP6_015589 [Peronosclerospora sorghi]|uniref:Uncharacterized protein n=1 Tax=Peronosclerospora sorghi TaxID=230839 RepID=A0ACC0WNK8_9STRA|nr:hypothetical protein PsorP6_015589 [Peronosclerospora sorghi]
MKERGVGVSRRSGDYSVLDDSGLTLTRSSQKPSSYGDKSFTSRLSDAMSDFSVDEGYADSFIDIERHFGRDTDDR